MIITLDLSTKIIGISILDQNKIYLNYIDFSKIEELINKNDYAIQELIKIINNRSQEIIFIFESYLKRFASGKSSIDTILKLARFNGMFTYGLYKQFPTAKFIEYNVLTARKLAGFKLNKIDKMNGKDTKKQILSFIQDYVNTESKIANKEILFDLKKAIKNKPPSPKDYCFDIADSLILLRAFLKINTNYKHEI